MSPSDILTGYSLEGRQYHSALKVERYRPAFEAILTEPHRLGLSGSNEAFFEMEKEQLTFSHLVPAARTVSNGALRNIAVVLTIRVRYSRRRDVIVGHKAPLAQL